MTMMMTYHSEHALILQQGTEAREEADEHDDGTDCDEDVRLGVVCRRVLVFEQQMLAQLVVASHPDAQREDRAAY